MIISDTCYGPLLISQYCCSAHDVTEITGRRNNADLLVITRRREPDVASSMYKSGVPVTVAQVAEVPQLWFLSSVMQKNGERE